MKELQQRGFNNAIFETNAHNIVGTICWRNTGVFKFSSIINKIKCLMSLYSDFAVKLIKHQANKITHTITRVTFSWPYRHVFESYCIHHILPPSQFISKKKLIFLVPNYKQKKINFSRFYELFLLIPIKFVFSFIFPITNDQ
ncbi:hypothetical protein QL285_012742 [Trifolium repens]|nr:hypothetical protein QL285_012742 [Trifolium repens]